MDPMFGKTSMVAPEKALPGRPSSPFSVPPVHAVNGNPLMAPYPDGMEIVSFGMGCFWGAERIFWQLPGVFVTAAGYQGGYTPFPTYEEVCSARTGHAEVVQVVYDPAAISIERLVARFFDEHDPTQGMRQGNDIGTQYRSAIYTTTDGQYATAIWQRDQFQSRLREAGYGAITTEIAPAGEFYFAEGYHQQYLHKVPNGYCGLAGTGVSCPTGVL